MTEISYFFIFNSETSKSASSVSPFAGWSTAIAFQTATRCFATVFVSSNSKVNSKFRKIIDKSANFRVRRRLSVRKRLPFWMPRLPTTSFLRCCHDNDNYDDDNKRAGNLIKKKIFPDFYLRATFLFSSFRG